MCITDLSSSYFNIDTNVLDSFGTSETHFDTTIAAINAETGLPFAEDYFHQDSATDLYTRCSEFNLNEDKY